MYMKLLLEDVHTWPDYHVFVEILKLYHFDSIYSVIQIDV